MSDIIIAVDAMGGDNAPFEIVKGCVFAVGEHKNIKIILIGREKEVQDELDKYSQDKSRIEIVNADEVIATEESPTAAIKNKKNSSMVIGLNLVKEGKAAAFISAGNTGALLTGAVTIIKRIKGVERPALGTLMPMENGKSSLLIDAGANVDAKPSFLVQFAKMGSVYMENVMGVKNPKVGLINIGAEKEKGNTLTKETYELLEEADINFVGNIEARDLFLGKVDVMVCDAFVGNVVLKFAEGFVGSILRIVKRELLSSFLSKVGALLSSGSFKRLKKYFDYSKVGGAPFIGLSGLVVKAHGNSEEKDIVGAINQCIKFIESDITNKIQEKI
ncbi:MAG: phosphate acyltransferase PlsX [Clostridiales bacterium]|jgi:glycerol-3-phosphate acyltransferase PlsX|nr:phosphate acyltransferase PlsX [Clostridiales bacterium]